MAALAASSDPLTKGRTRKFRPGDEAGTNCLHRPISLWAFSYQNFFMVNNEISIRSVRDIHRRATAFDAIVTVCGQTFASGRSQRIDV